MPVPGQRFLRWTVVQRLGSGSFGEVYKIADDTNNGEFFALKTENVAVEHGVLMMDVTVLQEATQQRLRHFCRHIDHGRYEDDFNFVVMTMVGPSLHDIRKSIPAEHFTMGTAIGAAIQTLEAIEELHRIGYLHRDIKPGNFSIGLAQRREQGRIFMLDFGMCRRFVNPDGTPHRPRQAAGFRGTPRYAPLKCHLSVECCRADDVESWVYMAVELTTASIPWRRELDMNGMAKWKQRVHQLDAAALQQLFRGCPSAYEHILRHVMTLPFYGLPDYRKYFKLLRNSLRTMHCAERPYDWERR